MVETTYDSRIDLMEVYVENDLEVGESVRSGNYIIHLSEDNQIVGLEVLSASKVLEVSPEFLKSITGADMVYKSSEKGREVYLTLNSGSKSVEDRFDFSKDLRKAVV